MRRTLCVSLGVCLLQAGSLPAALQVATPAGVARHETGRLELAEVPTGSFLECTRLVHSFLGEAAGDSFGWVSAPLGDVDGDGVQEVIVSAPFFDGPAASSGRVYVYSGRSGRELFRVGGNGGNWQLGFSVRSAGDVNGDGFDDVVAGAPVSSGRGRIRVYSGNPADGGALVFSRKEGAVGSRFGAAVTGIGDVDGDGVPDLAVGADNDGTAGAQAGRAWIVSGADGGVTVLWTIDGEAAGDHLGSAIANLGDVTGDGKDDLAVGAPDAGPGAGGKVYAYDVVNQTLLFEMLPDATSVDFGRFFVASPGDVDADGTRDVYVSDFNDFQNGSSAGKAYVFDGTDGSRIWVIPGEQAGDGFGIGRGAGDVDADGHADLLLCGWIHSGGATNAGRARVFSGKDLSVLQTITSITAQENLGFDAHGMGDVDGDGTPDFFLTAAGNGERGAGAGKCYQVAGGAPVRHYGSGVAGTGGLAPTIASADCPHLGATVTIEVTHGLPGALGAIVCGEATAALPLGAGLLLVEPRVVVPHTLVAPAGGVGPARFELAVPVGGAPASFGSSLYFQAAYLDPAAPGGIAISDGLAVTRIQLP